jgi:predicted porin
MEKNMYKRVLAPVVFAAITQAAVAQSNVTVYGVVDAGISYKNDGNPAGNTWGVESGQQSGSRIGFKGREDLGNGMFATFTLENGFNTDTGTFAQSNSNSSRLFGRQAWVGLEGNFGKIRLGRQQTELYYALDAVDPFHIGLAGNAQRVFGYGTYGSDPLARSDNTVSYTSPTVNGFTSSVSYGFGETAGDTSANRNVGFGARFVQGPMNVQFAYQKANTVTGPTSLGSVTGDERAAFIGATYDFGVAKAHAAYADNKLPTVNGDGKDRNYLLGVSAPAGAYGNVMASWTRNDVSDISSGNSDQYSIGYTHALSKRTNLYTSYSYLKNEDGVGLATYNDSVLGTDVKLFNVGMRHTF